MYYYLTFILLKQVRKIKISPAPDKHTTIDTRCTQPPTNLNSNRTHKHRLNLHTPDKSTVPLTNNKHRHKKLPRKFLAYQKFLSHPRFRKFRKQPQLHIKNRQRFHKQYMLFKHRHFRKKNKKTNITNENFNFKNILVTLNGNIHSIHPNIPLRLTSLYTFIPKNTNITYKNKHLRPALSITQNVGFTRTKKHYPTGNSLISTKEALIMLMEIITTDHTATYPLTPYAQSQHPLKTCVRSSHKHTSLQLTPEPLYLFQYLLKPLYLFALSCTPSANNLLGYR